MHLLAPFSKPKSHEDLFLEHYDWLVQWALQLSHGRREEATDLVHDLYVQLVRTRPDVDRADPDRIRGYLYTMLRNLSVSKARRHGRDALSSLLIVDYESVEFGLACIDRSKLILVRSDLARICEYACIRRDSSRSASVLILRFFLGYYPSEIAGILQVTRAAVEKHLQAARQEARVYLERPGVLRFLGQEITLASLSSSFLPDDPIALFAELRRRIFLGVKGVCLEESTIEERYIRGSSGINTPELAHVVSCVRCLELTNRVLGLGPLASRFPSDTINRDGDGNEPPGPTGRALDSDVFEKRARQSYEHVPMKLQVAVDGEVRAAQRVSSNRNELQVKLEPLARPAFLEVLSEQGIRLAYLQIEDSVGEPQSYVAIAELSDDRFVELKLNFVSGELVVSAYYYDPLQAEIRADVESQFLAARSVDIPADPSASVSSLRFATRRIGRLIHSWFPSLDSLWPLGLATAAAGLLLVGLGLGSNKPMPAAPATAAALLAKAQQFEQTKMSGGAAIHSTFSLETRSQDGKLLASQTVDSWRSLQPHRSALRLLDAKGRIVAAEWKDAKGITTRFPKKVQPSPDTTANAKRPPDFDEPWRAVAEGVASGSLATLRDKLDVRQESDGVDLHFDAADAAQASGLIKADWVLNAGSSQPVRGEMVLSENGGDREYRFRELTYDVVPASAVVDQNFSPDVSLRVSGAALIPSGGETNIAHVVIAALKFEDQLTCEFGDLLDVSRTADGKVEISGVLQSREAVAVVKQKAGSLLASGQLSVNLHSRDEMPPAIQKASVFPLTSVPVTLDRAKIPMDAELRVAFTDTGLTGEELEARILKAAQDGISHGAQAQRAAFKLHQLVAADLSSDELRHMSAADRATWLELVNREAKAVKEELVQVNVSLFPSASNTDKAISFAAPPGAAPIDSPEALGVAAANLDTDCSRLASLLINNLAVSAAAIPNQPNKSELKELLSQSRILGARINQTLVALSNKRQSAEQ